MVDKLSETGTEVGVNSIRNKVNEIIDEGVGGGGATTGETAPDPASEGQMWFSTNDRKLYVYADGQWVTSSDGFQYTAGSTTFESVAGIIEDFGRVEMSFNAPYLNGPTWRETGHSIPNFDANAIYAYIPDDGLLGYSTTMADKRYLDSNTCFFPLDLATLYIMSQNSDSSLSGDPYPNIQAGWAEPMFMIAPTTAPGVTHHAWSSSNSHPYVRPQPVPKGLGSFSYVSGSGYGYFRGFYEPHHGVSEDKIYFPVYDDDGITRMRGAVYTVYLNGSDGKFYFQIGLQSDWSYSGGQISTTHIVRAAIIWVKLNVTTLPVYKYTPNLEMGTYTH